MTSLDWKPKYGWSEAQLIEANRWAHLWYVWAVACKKVLSNITTHSFSSQTHQEFLEGEIGQEQNQGLEGVPG